MSGLIYFSSSSGYTRRFVEKLGLPAQRIPLLPRDEPLVATEPYVLVVPTYGGGAGEQGAVPKQVIKFLNVEANRALLRGVIASGNTNFGSSYCLAGNIVAAKCRTQVIYRFELMGTPEDVESVRNGLEEFWNQTPAPQSL